MDQELKELFGDMMVKDALVETCIVSYDYTEQEVRAFSKFLTELYPAKFDISMYDAAGATSAAPIYFDPKIIEWTDKDGVTREDYFVDGGVIQNNPSLYGLNIAQMAHGVNVKTRVVSIGTGVPPPNRGANKPDYSDFTVTRWWKDFTEVLLTTLTQYDATFESAQVADQYVRFNCVTEVDMDDWKAVDTLKA